jgi:hypothetical protein
MCRTINHCEFWFEQIILVLLGKMGSVADFEIKGIPFQVPPLLTLPESWESGIGRNIKK